MTKQQFLSGKEFMHDKYVDTCYFYEDDSIIEVYYYQGKIIRRKHEANVKSIGTKYFTYYTFVLGKRVSGKINFQNL